MDANFSTSPTQISSQAAAAQNAPGFQGYGGTLIASNHYGDVYQAGVVSQKRVSAPAMIADVLSILRQAGKGEGLDTAAAMTVREGLPVSEAAVEVIATRKLGKKDLERRIARLEAKAAVAKSQGDTTKYKKLKVRVAALRARLKDVRAGKVQAVRDLPEVAGDKGRIPSWVTWAGLALGAASLVVAVMAVKRRKGKKT
jgi:BMFP domain-containing protein YqiC